jgi:hypothetical protein
MGNEFLKWVYGEFTRFGATEEEVCPDIDFVFGDGEAQ